MSDNVSDALALHGDLARAGISPSGARRLPTRTELASGARFGDMDQVVDGATADLAGIFKRPGDVFLRTIRRRINIVTATPADLLETVTGLSRGSLGSGYTRSRNVAVENVTARLQQLVEESAEAAAKELTQQGISVQRVTDPDRERFIRAYVQSIIDEPALRAARAIEEAIRRNPANPDAVDEALAAAAKAASTAPGSGPRDLMHSLALMAQSMGRAEVLSQATHVVWVASELRDTATCDRCLTVDGTVFSTWREAAEAYPLSGYLSCRGGLRCRGTVICQRA